MTDLATLSMRLSAASREQLQDPYALFAWPASLSPDADWYTSPELITLYGTKLWDRLSEPARKRLSFWEAVNFYSLNIHGERALMQGLSARLYRPETEGITPYLHHFLDEENKHSVLFGGFCTRYASKIYPDRKIMQSREELLPGQEDILFFGKVLIFEEIVDGLNAHMARDGRLHEVARRINLNHHVEESRHLVFGRHVLKALWSEHARRWPEGKTNEVARYFEAYLRATWREYYNPAVYQDADLPGLTAEGDARLSPWDIQAIAWESDASRSMRDRMSVRCFASLRAAGVLQEE